MEDKFAEGICFQKIFFIFVIGSIFGTYFEEILWFIRNQNWVSRQGVLYGPFSPLYGLGLGLFLILLGKNYKKYGFFKTVFCGALIGGITEYFIGYILDICFGVKFWDYSSMAFNIHGRTTIPIMIIWGIFGSFFLFFVYPILSKWIEKIPNKVGEILFFIFFLFLFLDICLSFSVFGRMVARRDGNKPMTFIGEFYDMVYNDEYMFRKFPILKDSGI